MVTELHSGVQWEAMVICSVACSPVVSGATPTSSRVLRCRDLHVIPDFHLALAAVPSVAGMFKDIKAAQPANIQDWQWFVVVVAHTSPLLPDMLLFYVCVP